MGYKAYCNGCPAELKVTVHLFALVNGVWEQVDYDENGPRLAFDLIANIVFGCYDTNDTKFYAKGYAQAYGSPIGTNPAISKTIEVPCGA